MAGQPTIPKDRAFYWPTLRAIKALGGSGSIQEIERKVAEIVRLTDEQQSVPHKGGRYTEVNYRLAWARTYLKVVGYLNTTGRGVWSITESGQRATESDMESVDVRARAIRSAQKAAEASIGEEQDGSGEVEAAKTWRDVLLARLLEIPPDRFEHLAKRLLREAGFIQVEVTKQSGDGGVDGTGIYRPSLVSFPVFFQCKRYKGSVGAAIVRDFRGAMAGRGDQGLLITTGYFTTEAKAEASRPGAPLVDLIDGDSLCTLLKEHRLGIRVTARTVEDVEVVSEFFDTV